MRVYIAAPWDCQTQARAARETLRAAGLHVVARWLDVVPDEPYPPERLAVQARQDWEDVQAADALLLLNLHVSEGKAVETGLALAWCVPVVVVGAPSNVFHYLPGRRLRLVETLAEAVAALQALADAPTAAPLDVTALVQNTLLPVVRPLPVDAACVGLLAAALLRVRPQTPPAAVERFVMRALAQLAEEP